MKSKRLTTENAKSIEKEDRIENSAAYANFAEDKNKGQKAKMLFRERQQIVIFIVAGAIIGGGVLFRYLPLRKKVKAIKQTKTAQTLAITKGEAQSKQLPVLKEQLLKLKRVLGDYEAGIPVQRGLGVFLTKIANLMSEHNLREQEIAPGVEIEADKLNCIPVNMKCKGTLTQVFEFYKELQGLDRLVRIEQVKLYNDSNFGGEVSMETKAVVYYRAEVGQG